MPWFKVDDTLSGHPKARQAGLPAMGLWVVCGSYASQYLTEGFVPDWFVTSWPQGKKLAARLVDAGLWDAIDDGWIFHQWGERQPTKEQVEAERASTRERVQRWRDKKRTEAVTNAVSSGVTDSVTNTAQARPVPSLVKNSQSERRNLPSKLTASFDEFWSIYPKRVGRADAERKFVLAAKSTDPTEIVAGARRYAAASTSTEPRFIAHPSTWLHQGRWADEATSSPLEDDPLGWAR